MYKLSGHSLTRGEWFEPESQPMALTERDSTTSITLGPDAPAIAFDDWLLDDDWPEGPYVWRVRGVNEDALTDTRTVELEHVIKALDDICLGEVTPATIAGSGATTCTAKQAVQYILSNHSAWTLGDFEYSESLPYEFDGDTLLDALDSVTDSLDSAVWEYDLSVFPFKLHVRQRDNTVRCEMRGERNLLTLKKSITRSGMYTRIYPTGKNNLQVDGGYLSKNEGTYGRVDHRETDQSKSTKASLQSWAQGRLNKHCEPRVSIQISGLELSQETGETLDNLQLNKVCQCPLPEYGTTITERIVKKQWRDRRKEPETVTITLANNSQDVTTIIKEQTRGGGGGKAGAGQAKQNYLFEANGEHLLYEVFDECGHVHGLLRMTSESLRIAFENLNDSTRSEFMLTAESLRIQFENEISSTRSEFQMTSESLRIQFENEISSTRSEFEMTSESMRIQFENEISSTRSEFQMTSESLRIEFQNEASGLRSEFQMSANSIRLAISGVTDSSGNVTAASIALAINNAGDSVATINASKIYLLGQTIANQITADYIATKIATLSSLTVSSIACSGTIGANELQVGTLKFRSSSGSGYSYSDLKDLFVTSVAVTGPVNNVYTLKYYTANSAEGTSGGTFSRAVSSFTGTWSGNHYQVTVSPQNQTGGDTYLFTSADEWTDEHKKTVHVYYFSGGNPVDVLTPVIDAGSVYTEGFEAGEGQFTRQTITLQGSQTSDITIQGAAATTTTVTLQGSQTASLTLQGEAQTVYEVVGSGGTVYYTAGTAKTYYDAGTAGTYYDAGTAVTVYPGNGGSFTVQGDAGPKLKSYGNTQLYYKSGSTYYTAGGQRGWYYQDSGGTQYYKAGTTTKYARGTGYSITPIGTAHTITPVGAGHAVTPIGSSSLRLSSCTRYKAGTNVGRLYNAGSVATYYPATETLYKAGTNIGKLYNAGTISTDYYTKA